jgi:hypothetical protein
MRKRVLIPGYCLVGIYQQSDELSCPPGMYPHSSLVDGVSGGRITPPLIQGRFLRVRWLTNRKTEQ